MQKFRVTCPDGFTKDVDAETQDAAVEMLMSDPDVTAHTRDNHPELAGKTPEEMKEMLAGMVAPVME